MATFRCRMCGGTFDVNNETVTTCVYCGMQQTVPRLNDDNRANMYDWANYFLWNNQYDEAMNIYKQILSDDPIDAEAYWSLVLCRYGIKYVKDSMTYRCIPMINRAQFTSIFDDNDYKSAIWYADVNQKAFYEKTANTISRIQNEILAISRQVEPFDVFICYKETDNNGCRSQDSMLANDLYYQLTREGFKVFFGHITLADKKGLNYEPYIFSALNSAKVMIVLGTKQEYFNDVWVKNEWSRYLSIVKDSGGKKILIPVYKDMNPCNLPEEFSYLQAQDISGWGFVQNLISVISKLTRPVVTPIAATEETSIISGNQTIESLLKRAFIFLEDQDWKSAYEYCERVLDMDPENAKAYIGKLMVEQRVCRQEQLKDCKYPFDRSSNYIKAIRFADDEMKAVLRGYIDYINERNCSHIYEAAVRILNTEETEYGYKKAARFFESIIDYKDSKILMEKCYEKAEIVRKNAILADGKDLMESAYIFGQKKAIERFESIPGWKDADKCIDICRRKIWELEAKEYADDIRKKKKKEIKRIETKKRIKRKKILGIVATVFATVFIVAAVILITVVMPEKKYNEAVSLIKSKNFAGAYEILRELGDYKNSSDICSKYIKEEIKASEVGETIFFGTYEQDNHILNGKENIEWLILKKDEEKALLISKYALDVKPYEESPYDVTWETCSLRGWLNANFKYIAFSKNERNMIITTTVSADENPEYNTNPGNETEDQIFLLSVQEAEQYFDSDLARRCEPTEYVIEQIRSQYHYHYYIEKNYRWWWLRSPGSDQNYAVCIDVDGNIKDFSACDDETCVRPAMWVELEP